MNSGISIVIPAYNEENGIAGTVENLHRVLKKMNGMEYEIIVVDDGSRDQTGQKVAGLGVKVIRHPKNLGYGKSIVTGIQHAKHELIGIIDADGSYEAEDLNKMVPLMDTFDMVIGKRDMSAMKQSALVLLMRLFLKTIFFYFTGHTPPDANSGIRVFKKDLVLQNVNLFSLKYSFSTSLTLLAFISQRFVEYVPAKYYPRIGVSKVRHVRDSLRTLILIVSVALIYRPLRLFIAYILGSTAIAFIIGLMEPLMSLYLWITLIAAFAFVIFLTGLGSLSFILSKIYESLKNKE